MNEWTPKRLHPDSIRDSIRIRIVAADSIRDSIRKFPIRRSLLHMLFACLQSYSSLSVGAYSIFDSEKSHFKIKFCVFFEKVSIIKGNKLDVHRPPTTGHASKLIRKSRLLSILRNCVDKSLKIYRIIIIYICAIVLLVNNMSFVFLSLLIFKLQLICWVAEFYQRARLSSISLSI